MSQQPLPLPLRAATMAAIVVGAMVSWGAARDVAVTLTVAGRDTATMDVTPWRGLFQGPEQEALAKEMAQAMLRAQSLALESMQTSRVLILVALSGAATLVFVAALRLRWPGGVPRTGVAKFLGGAAVASAVLRTLDGAQELVVVRRALSAALKVMAARPLPGPPLPEGLTRGFVHVYSVGFTVAVVASFLLLGRYFRSERVQETFRLLDKHVEEE